MSGKARKCDGVLPEQHERRERPVRVVHWGTGYVWLMLCEEYLLVRSIAQVDGRKYNC